MLKDRCVLGLTESPIKPHLNTTVAEGQKREKQGQDRPKWAPGNWMTDWLTAWFVDKALICYSLLPVANKLLEMQMIFDRISRFFAIWTRAWQTNQWMDEHDLLLRCVGASKMIENGFVICFFKSFLTERSLCASIEWLGGQSITYSLKRSF